MIRKSLAFVLVAFLLISGLASRSHAQHLQYVEQSGSISLDGLNSMSVYVFANQYVSPDPTKSTGLSGTVTINGFLGGKMMTINANIDAVSYSTVKIGSRYYKQAVLTTEPFYYCIGRKQTAAQGKITVQGYGLGVVNFQVVSLVDGTTLAASINPNTGEWMNPSLFLGYTTIIF